ncbi:MAG: hypothetical protein LDLANPLL_02784 [Turneriella sp.]|nr:hypothetical protein [Turneriella sp.]
MRFFVIFLFLGTPLLSASIYAEEVYLTCTVTQITASEKTGKTDAKLKKIIPFIKKDESFNAYQSFRSKKTKTLSATKKKKASIKLINGKKFSLKPVSVVRAHRQNTVTLDVSLDGNSENKSFIDRKYLLMKAGDIPKGGTLILAVTCPVFP